MRPRPATLAEDSHRIGQPVGAADPV